MVTAATMLQEVPEVELGVDDCGACCFPGTWASEGECLCLLTVLLPRNVVLQDAGLRVEGSLEEQGAMLRLLTHPAVCCVVRKGAVVLSCNSLQGSDLLSFDAEVNALPCTERPLKGRYDMGFERIQSGKHACVACRGRAEGCQVALRAFTFAHQWGGVASLEAGVPFSLELQVAGPHAAAVAPLVQQARHARVSLLPRRAYRPLNKGPSIDILAGGMCPSTAVHMVHSLQHRCPPSDRVVLVADGLVQACTALGHSGLVMGFAVQCTSRMRSVALTATGAGGERRVWKRDFEAPCRRATVCLDDAAGPVNELALVRRHVLPARCWMQWTLTAEVNASEDSGWSTLSVYSIEAEALVLSEDGKEETRLWALT